MLKNTLPAGTVHAIVPDFLRRALVQTPAALAVWNDITPLARNEWICLVSSGKQQVTTDRRLKRTIDQLSRGQRRPCCWLGCAHRDKNGK